MNAISKKELFYFIKTKRVLMVFILLTILFVIPLTDYKIYKESLIDITGADYIRLLNCGGGMFLGFSFNCIWILTICVGIMFHNEFKYKTFLYEKMSGVSMFESITQRFWIIFFVVLMELFLIGGAFVFFVKKNELGFETSIWDMILKFTSVFFSSLHVAFVTGIITIIFKSAYKAIMISFIRYIVLGFLWGTMGMNLDKNIYIQFVVLDPFNCLSIVFSEGLVMDNFIVIASVTILSFFVNVGLWLWIACILDQKKHY